MATEMKDKAQILFDDILVKDNHYHYPDDLVAWIDGFKIDKIIFGVINGCDKVVSIQPIGRAGSAVGNLGLATSVAANSETVVPLNLRNFWSPYLAVSVKAASAPSAGGRITIFAVVK